MNANEVNLSKTERTRRIGVAIVTGAIVVSAGLEVLAQYRRVDPRAQLVKGPPEARDDTLALAKAKRFRPLRDAVRGVNEVGFISDPATEWVADRMMIQSLVAPTLVTDPKLPADPHTLIGSFPDEAALDGHLARNGNLTARQRLGEGLAVLERKGP